ncbi:MAG: hypothetical protein IKI02_07665 [Oscillospiraceae bacterium]|nr:hypothetical protein [Oscillospiraceae bacterium]
MLHAEAPAHGKGETFTAGRTRLLRQRSRRFVPPPGPDGTDLTTAEAS